MKLWLITPKANTKYGGYDTYDSAIVAATTEEKAVKIHPSTFKEFGDDGEVYFLCADGSKKKESYSSGDWVSSVDDVKAELIGTAKKGTESGVILASFNAG